MAQLMPLPLTVSCFSKIQIGFTFLVPAHPGKKGKGSPYLITEHRILELIAVLGSQPAGDVSHKPGGRLPLLSARPAVTPATLKRAATNLLFDEQRHNGCEQFAQDCYPTASRLRFEPGPSAPESSTLTTRLPSHPPAHPGSPRKRAVKWVCVCIYNQCLTAHRRCIR